MSRNRVDAVTRTVRYKRSLPFVRTQYQFGPANTSFKHAKLFLDDDRNPPLREEGWVVVRNVADAIAFMNRYGNIVTTLSLDNDLGPDPQGIDFLKWVISEHKRMPFLALKKIIVHTGNLPKGRAMMKMLRKSKFQYERRIPHERIYPRRNHDTRIIHPYTR